MGVPWEYKVLKFAPGRGLGVFAGSNVKAEAVEQQLNQLGKDGWELVTSVSSIGQGSTTELGLILKRPK